MRFAILVVALTMSLPAQDAKNGRRVYTAYGCYQCHGREAQGSTITGSRLGPRPIALAAFKLYTRRPGGQMPPYSEKILSEQELADMYAFVQSLPPPPAVESIPQLR